MSCLQGQGLRVCFDCVPPCSCYAVCVHNEGGGGGTEGLPIWPVHHCQPNPRGCHGQPRHLQGEC